MTLAELSAHLSAAESAACQCDLMIGFQCSNHATFSAMRVRVRILLKIIQAQAKLLVAYRTTSRAPEKASDLLAKHRDLINEIVKEKP